MTASRREEQHADVISLHVPFGIVRRGGRKEMQSPDGLQDSCRIDSALVKALARAFRWKRMLEAGDFAAITELAGREGITPSYVTRDLRLKLLSPDHVDAILEGREKGGKSLAEFLEPFPVEWSMQTRRARQQFLSPNTLMNALC